VTCVIQPGGSICDEEVIDAANAAGLAMVFTSERYFGHLTGGGSTRPVVPHQFNGPVGLANVASRQEAGHAWLDVDDRGAIDSVECSDADGESVDAEQFARGHAESVGSHAGALGEDPHLGPVGVPSRSTGTGGDIVGIDLVEHVDDIEVRELVEPGEDIGTESFRIDLDSLHDGTPAVVCRLDSTAPHISDRFDSDHRLFPDQRFE